MTNSFDQAVESVRNVIESKQDILESWWGFLGDGSGNVAGRQKNYVLVRASANSSPVEIYGANVAALPDGVRVKVGYTAEMPHLPQVLTELQADQNLDDNSGVRAILPHRDSHNYLAPDQITVDWRQITQLKVQPYTGLTVYINAGTIPRPGTDIYFLPQIVDLSGSVPNTAGQARYALISIDSTGTPVITDGTPVTPALTLDISDIPATPAGNFRVAAVMLKYGQTDILENSGTRRDIFDLRWPQESGALPVDAGSLSPGTAQYQYLVTGGSPYTFALSSGFLHIVSAKTLTVNNSLTLAGTDSTTLTLTTALTNQGAAGVLNWGGAYTLGINNSLTLAGYDNSSTLTIGGDVAYSRSARIYALGDSLTSTTYTSRLETDRGFPWRVLNLGVSGEATPELVIRLPEITGAGDAKYAIVFEGSNDVRRDYSAVSIEANYITLYTALHNAGAKVVAVTVTPFKGHADWSAGRQTVLDAINAWIIANAIGNNADYVVDAYALLEDPGNPDTLLAAYDSGDHLHLSTAGYQALADAINTGVTWTASLTQKTLKISGAVDLNQSLTTTDIPTFRSLIVDEPITFAVQGAGTLNKTGAGALTLSSAGAYTITAPASLTLAGINVANVFTLNQTITKDVPALLLYTTSVSANARNWDIQSNYSAYGDFAVVQSNALGGNPQTAGTPRIYVSYQGSAGFGTTNTVIGDGTYFAALTANSTGAIGTGSFYYLRTDAAENRSGLWIKAGTTTAGWLSGVMVGGGYKIGYGNGANETASLTNAILINTSGFELSTAGIWTQMLNNATTNAVDYHLIEHRNSGTSANGFGIGVKFQLQSTTTYAQDAAVIEGLWVDATHASRKADLILSAYDTAKREGVRVYANGSLGLVGVGLGADPAAILHVGASVAGAASMRIPAGTAPSSPAEGDKWNDSTQKADIAFIDGIKQSRVGCIFTQTADVTVASTASETTLIGTGIGTATLPANFFTVGKTIRIGANGHYSTANPAGTLQIKVKLGTTVILDTTAATMTNGLTNLGWTIAETVITCRTTGATGTVMGQGYTEFSTTHTNTTIDDFTPNTTAVTIDTTTSQAISITAQWGTSSASNTITATNITIEVLN